MIRDLGRLALVGFAVVVAVAAYGAYRIWDQGARTSADRRAPSSSSVPPSTTAVRRRSSPPGWTTPWHLFLTGDYRWFVVTGGKADGDRTTEAAVARAYAIAHGVPADRILIEDHGRTTLESLEAVAGILRQKGIHDAVFVSDPTHMLRVLRMAEDLGIRAWGSPTPTSPIEADGGRLVAAYVHELGALALYLTVGGAPAGELAEPR